MKIFVLSQMHESKMGATTFSRQTFIITLKSVSHSMTEITTARCHYADHSMLHVIYAQYHVFVMLNVIVLNVFVLNVVVLIAVAP
jgi:hypothetical protein